MLKEALVVLFYCQNISIFLLKRGLNRYNYLSMSILCILTELMEKKQNYILLNYLIRQNIKIIILIE